MPPMDRKRHLLLPHPKTERYKYPKEVRGGARIPLPSRNRGDHGTKLTSDLAQVRAEMAELTQRRAAVGVRGERGICLEIASHPGFELALKSLDRRDRGKRAQHIELLAVREQADTVFATVFVPEGKLATLEGLVGAYLTKMTRPTKRNPAGRPANQDFIESVEQIRRAAFDSFWTDALDAYPGSEEALWWEVWLRAGEDRDALVQKFREQGITQGLRIERGLLKFPDRTVCLAHGTTAQMASSAELLDCVAELRRAKDLASFFTEMRPAEQAEWVDSMAKGLAAPPASAPAVCILDSGITQGHPLIRPGLEERDLHTYRAEWGTADAARWHGHGTSMAGLALHGDLTEALADSQPRELEHRLESVKILPPGGFPENDRELYGVITQYGTGLPEITAPTRRRVFALAATADDFRDRGAPSSWSAEIDSLAFGDDRNGQRLFVIAAGNVSDPEQWKHYPDSNDLEEVRDPGQSWNALTVGAYTEKATFDAQKYPDWVVMAPRGALSPASTTSVQWKTWPRKPDLVMEGGNAAVNPATGEVDPIDDLALLTTYWRPADKLLIPTGDTSAATAQAARLGAILMARYPRFLPETIRALMVHSAEWTPGMWEQVAGQSSRGKKHNLLRQRYGWGVPNLNRACWSASNVLTLVAQETLRPYGDRSGGSVPTQDMHLHELPWPKEQLLSLAGANVRLRVTLSYFIEPNPARRGWKYRHLYASHGLRFEIPRPTETLRAFRARITKEAQAELDGDPDHTASDWTLRDRRGSVHSDWWEGMAADLARLGYVAVFPVGGWWKERPHLERWRKSVRYSLVVTIDAGNVDVDIYTPIAAQIEAMVAAEV